MTQICVGKLTIIGSDNGLSPGRRQAIIWTKCWNIANLTLMNKFQWYFYQNSIIFIPENELENVVCEMASILSRPQCVNNSVAVRYKKSISIIETVISIDYRYIDFLASYFSDRSRGIDRVGDNLRTVNTSANPHISDQLTELRTEYTW